MKSTRRQVVDSRREAEMSIELTPGETKFIEDLIAAGEVRTADEAVASPRISFPAAADVHLRLHCVFAAGAGSH
jgi:hypothetical protein